MSALSAYARRSFSGPAAALALAVTMTGSAPAQTSVAAPAAKLPEACVAFEGDTSRRAQKYDEPLGMIVDQLKTWSGWPALRAQMKAANLPFDGLCPSARTPGRIVPMPQARGFALNIVDPETRQAVTPEKFVAMIKDEEYQITADIVTLAGTMIYHTEANPLFANDQDLETVIVLKTALSAAMMSDMIVMAVEAATKLDRKAALNKFYENMPALVADINDLNAQVLVAKGQNRTLTQEERNNFSKVIFSHLLKDPEIRAAFANGTGESIAGIIVHKMAGDVATGKTPTAPAFKALTPAELGEKLKRFPGNLGGSDVLRDYKAYWAANPDKDIAKEIQKVLDAMPAQVLESIRKGGSPAARPQAPGLNFQLQ